MNTETLIVQQPEGTARQLVLLMHGVGSVPQSMLETARWFAQRDRQAWVISVAAPERSDISIGWQWFSVRGVTEENRPARVDAAMPGFADTVRHWQRATGLDAARTLIAGFSQGAIMALESTRLAEPVAARVVAMAGRYATLPRQRPDSTIHLTHGSADAVMPVALAQAAHAHLLQLGAHATLDVVPGIGHVPLTALLDPLAARLPAEPAG